MIKLNVNLTLNKQKLIKNKERIKKPKRPIKNSNGLLQQSSSVWILGRFAGLS
jgi:hypothetical protein